MEIFGMKGRLMGDTILGQNDGGILNEVIIEKNVSYNSTQNHADDKGRSVAAEFGNMYTREIESFSDSVLNDRPLDVPASDAVHVQRIIGKAYESMQTHKIYEI